MEKKTCIFWSAAAAAAAWMGLISYTDMGLLPVRLVELLLRTGCPASASLRNPLPHTPRTDVHLSMDGRVNTGDTHDPRRSFVRS
jgi:hypothetical protein